MFIYEGQLQTLPLEGLRQGREHLLVLTNPKANWKLQFKHAGDPTWRDYPGASGVADSVSVIKFHVASADMQLVFDAEPSAKYYLSTPSCTSGSN